MRYIFGFITIFIIGSGYAQGPKRDEVEITKVNASGSGCSTDNIWIPNPIKGPGGPPDSIRVSYLDEHFTVKNPGNSFKECSINFELKYPIGWSYTILDLESEGYVDLAKSHLGTLNFEYKIGKKTVQKVRTLKGPFQGRFTFNDRFKENIWFPCEVQTPVTLTTKIKIEGKEKGTSILTMEGYTNKRIQSWGLRWRRCSPE